MYLTYCLQTLIAASLVVGTMGSIAAVAAGDIVPVPRAKHPTERSTAIPGAPQMKPELPRFRTNVVETVPRAREVPTAQAVPCTIKFLKFVDQPPVVGENGCGFSSAVRLVSTGGDNTVRFQPAPLIGCKLARAIGDWLTKDVSVLAREIMGEELAEIQTGPGYTCRRRNNLPDGKLSEHALGTALDITAFVLKSGAIVSVKQDWRASKQETSSSSRFLRDLHSSACKRFTTVLGPDADAHHNDHVHLDTGCHGKTCTYRICQ